MNVIQWETAALKIQVWNRDTFVTDDFLGQVVIPLKSLTPADYNEDATVTEEYMDWNALAPRHDHESVCGEIEVGVRLIMTDHTTSRAEAAGGAMALLEAVTSRHVSLAASAAAQNAKQVTGGWVTGWQGGRVTG